MTGRIERMRKAATETPIVIGLEKLRIAMDTLEECRNLPAITYRSTLHANYYNRMPISIPDDDLICGTGSSHHNGVELDYEMGVWSKAELDHLKEETGDMYYISPFRSAHLMTPSPSEMQRPFCQMGISNDFGLLSPVPIKTASKPWAKRVSTVISTPTCVLR